MFTCRLCDSLGPLGPPQEVVGGWKPPKTKQQRGKPKFGAAAAPEPAWHPSLGHSPPSSSPCRGAGGAPPPRLPGPLPSRWRISSQELLISSPEPGGNCVGARRGLCGGRRAGSARGERSQRGSCCFQPPSSPFLPPLGSRERGELLVGFAPPVLGGCDLPRAVP